MAMAVPSYDFGNGYDDDRGYCSPLLWLWLCIAMAKAMDMTMVMAMAIAVTRHGACPTWHLHDIRR